MLSPAILRKQDKELPDSYGLRIIFHDKSFVDLDIVSMRWEKENGTLEYITSDNKVGGFPVPSFRHYELDERWTKICELRSKMEQENAIQESGKNDLCEEGRQVAKETDSHEHKESGRGLKIA